MTAPVTYAISRFRHSRDTVPVGAELTWDELVVYLTSRTFRLIKDGPCWSPNLYRPGATRRIEGVLEVTMAVLDVDDGQDPVPVHHRLKAAGICHVICSSFSSTVAHPKFRVIVPLTSPVPADEWRSVQPGLFRSLLGSDAYDHQAVDVTRLFYEPSARHGAVTFGFIGTGIPFDWRLLERVPVAPRRARRPAPPIPPPSELELAEARAAVAAPELRSAFGKALRAPIVLEPPFTSGSRHGFLLRSARSLVAAGCGPSEAHATLLAINERACSPPKGGDEVERAVQYGYEWSSPRPTTHGGRYVPPKYVPPPSGRVALIRPGQATSPTSESCGRTKYRGHEHVGKWHVAEFRTSCNDVNCPQCYARLAHREGIAAGHELAVAVGAPDADGHGGNAPKGAVYANASFWRREVVRLVVTPIAQPVLRDESDYRAFRRAAENAALAWGMCYSKVLIHDQRGVAGVAGGCPDGLHAEVVGFRNGTPRSQARIFTRWSFASFPISGQPGDVVRALYITSIRATDPEIAASVLRLGTHPRAEESLDSYPRSAKPRVPTLAVVTIGAPPGGGREHPKVPPAPFWCSCCACMVPRDDWKALVPVAWDPGQPPPRCPLVAPIGDWVVQTGFVREEFFVSGRRSTHASESYMSGAERQTERNHYGLRWGS